MKALVMYPKPDPKQPWDHNRMHPRRPDPPPRNYTGTRKDEDMFRSWAGQFKQAHPGANVKTVGFKEDDTAGFVAALRDPSHQNLDVFAYIGHGFPRSLSSAALWDSGPHFNRFVEGLVRACKPNATWLFYSCSSGGLGNSFVRNLYRRTASRGFRMYGHFSVRHATRSGDITVFPPGSYLIDRVLAGFAKVPRFKWAWKAAMWNQSDLLWARFFLMSEAELRRYVMRKALQRAAKENRKLMKSVGWEAELGRIWTYLATMGFLEGPTEEDLAYGIALWELGSLPSRAKTDGKLDRATWAKLSREISAVLGEKAGAGSRGKPRKIAFPPTVVRPSTHAR